MCEVEAILNCRPLGSISDDPDDLEPLPPNHLLLQGPGPTFPPRLFDKGDLYARRTWKQVQYLAHLFWTRWRREYLTHLQSRQKWTKGEPPHRVGDLVLVIEYLLPRKRWALGRISEVMPDRNHDVRVVRVRTVNVKDANVRSKLDMIRRKAQFADLVRPISKLILLKSVDEL